VEIVDQRKNPVRRRLDARRALDTEGIRTSRGNHQHRNHGDCDHNQYQLEHPNLH